ncbi:MAG: hypothetical protein RJB66_33 [Pseudomonadota bacterium]|jgi:hypothetical protein
MERYTQLSDRCILVRVKDDDIILEEGVSLLINTETLDHIYLRDSTLIALAKTVAKAVTETEPKKTKKKVTKKK